MGRYDDRYLSPTNESEGLYKNLESFVATAAFERELAALG